MENPQTQTLNLSETSDMPRRQSKPLLPTEIKLNIAQYITSRNDILSLIITDSTFLEIFRPILYRRIRIPLREKQSTISCIRWLRSIIANPQLAACVLELDLKVLVIEDRWVWLAGSAFDRLLVKGLKTLRNLKILSFLSTKRFLWLLNIPTLQFPQLEQFRCSLIYHVLPFLQRHRSVTKLELLTSHHSPEFSGTIASCLPDLTRYAGPVELIQCVIPLVGFQRLKTALGEFGHNILTETRALLSCGSTLRSLNLTLRTPYEGLLGQVFLNMPLLESLWIHLTFSEANHLNTFLMDFRKSNANMACLQSFVVLNFYWSGALSSVDMFLHIQELQHSLYPALRLINLTTTHGKGADINSAWRYSDTKKLWIAPLSDTLWWNTAPSLGVDVTPDDYIALAPCMPTFTHKILDLDIV